MKFVIPTFLLNVGSLAMSIFNSILGLGASTITTLPGSTWAISTCKTAIYSYCY